MYQGKWGTERVGNADMPIDRVGCGDQQCSLNLMCFKGRITGRGDVPGGYHIS